MKKKLNIDLYKSLVFTDFFFYTLKQTNSNLNFSLQKNLNLLYKKNIIFLNIFELQKEIKQLIKLLSNLKKNINKNLLVIIVENNQQKILINHFITFLKIPLKIVVKNQDDFFNFQDIKTDLKFIISFVHLKEQKIKSFASNQKILLIDEINSDVKKKKSSTIYNITNKIDTNNKIYFLLILLEIVFKI
jgi:hypothetical protein